jgi:hypothetical protein
VLGKKPDHIHVVIQEINEEDWGFAGQLTDDWKKSQTLSQVIVPGDAVVENPEQ